MVLVAIHLHIGHDIHHHVIHTDIQIAFPTHGVEELAIVSLSASHHRSQNVDGLAVVVVENQFENLVLGIFHHLLSRHIAVCRTGTGKEKSHEIIDLGDGAHGRTRILVGGLLLDADDRTQAGNLVHVGTLHAAEKIAGIGRKGFNITPLAFGIKSVESQTGFSAAAQSCNHRETVAGDCYIDILEIMYPSTEHFNIGHPKRISSKILLLTINLPSSIRLHQNSPLPLYPSAH